MIHTLFSRVAARYDLMNDVMSFGVHRMWKKEFISHAPLSAKIIVDLAGGTGDIAKLLVEQGKTVHTCDLTYAMLKRGREKLLNAGYGQNHTWCVGRAEDLPFKDAMADAVTMVFGLRNVDNRIKTLEEIHRILKPGGVFLCMEFCPQPTHLLAPLYEVYLRYFIPFLGGVIAKDRDAYQYLADSIRAFWTPAEVIAHMDSFQNATHTPLWGGVVAIYKGEKI